MPRRVQIKEDGGSYYTFPINPIEFENQDSDDIATQVTIDGQTVSFKIPFDGRARTMTWKNLPNKSPYSTLITQLKTYKGLDCVIKLRDLSGDTTDETEQNVRVLNVETKYSSRGIVGAEAYLEFETVVLTYVPR